jgi:hypothetical protein
MPSSVLGSVVFESPGWGFVNHSSNVDISDNVAYFVRGAAFATEVGDEIGGFYGNLAIGTTGTTETINAREAINDFGFGGDGYWFQGAGTSVVGNISAGNQGNAFVYYTRGLYEGPLPAQFVSANLPDPSIANGQPTIPVGLVPVRLFSGNVGYASHTGLQVRYHLENATHGARSIFQDSKFWNNSLGVDLPYAQNSSLRNLSILNGLPTKPTVGIRANMVTRNINYENLTITNHNTAIELPYRSQVLVNGGTFVNNNQDIVLFSAAVENRNVLITGLTGQPKIQTVYYTYPIYNNTAEAYFVNDVTILNFGPFVNQRLYGLMQHADAVPFPVPRYDLPSDYVGLTNQELWDQYNVALGGAVAPPVTYTVPYINGLLAPA